MKTCSQRLVRLTAALFSIVLGGVVSANAIATTKTSGASGGLVIPRVAAIDTKQYALDLHSVIAGANALPMTSIGATSLPAPGPLSDYLLGKAYSLKATDTQRAAAITVLQQVTRPNSKTLKLGQINRKSEGGAVLGLVLDRLTTYSGRFSEANDATGGAYLGYLEPVRRAILPQGNETTGLRQMLTHLYDNSGVASKSVVDPK